MATEEYIFDQIINSGEDIAVTFKEKLSEIFAHTQREILDFCGTLDKDQLVAIRSILFDKVQIILPAYNSHELVIRRNKGKLCEDIYVIGNCVVSKLEDRRLKRIVKSDTSSELSLSQADKSTLIGDDTDVLHICATLKSTVDALSLQVSRLKTRVGILEEDLSVAVETIQALKRPKQVMPTNQEKEESNDTESLSSDLEEDQGPVEPESSRSTDQPTVITSPQQNRIVPQIEPEEPNRKDSAGLTENQGFRLSNDDRRKIRKGNKGHKVSTAEMNLNKNIIGNSHGNHNIKSAEPTPCNETDQSGPFYVYVGRLSPDTSEQSLRTHLDGIGVTNINVTDVIKLNSRNENQSSFCITLSSKASKNLMFSPENWPAGIMIRPYIQKNTQSRNQNKSTRQYYDDPPRSRNWGNNQQHSYARSNGRYKSDSWKVSHTERQNNYNSDYDQDWPRISLSSQR